MIYQEEKHHQIQTLEAINYLQQLGAILIIILDSNPMVLMLKPPYFMAG